MRALIDQGSEISVITETLAQRLRLPRSRTSVAVIGVGGQKTGVARGSVGLTLMPRNGGQQLLITTMVLPRLTAYAGVSGVESNDWTHLRDLPLADPEFAAPDRIDVLLGADVYAMIIGPGVRRGGHRDPIAQQTSLGWIVSGPVSALSVHTTATLHQCSVDETLTSLVRKFWSRKRCHSSA